MRKKLNRMRGREITEFGDLGSRVAELYSPFLTLTGGNYQNPLVLRQDGREIALSLLFFVFFNTPGPAGNGRPDGQKSFWLQLLICLDSMGWIEG